MSEQSNQPIIVAKSIKKIFLDGKIQALRGVDMSIRHGEFVVIYGPSGCGKSTLLGLLAALDQPSSGAIYVEGKNINRLDSKNAALYRRHEVGMVFQQFNLVATLSALDNVALPMVLAGVGRDESEKRASHILSIFGMENRKKHKPAELSGGEQQRVAIARALALNPTILLVDEPTGNLDEENSKQVLDTLREINSWGRTVVMVTHNPDYAKVADRVLEMKDGTIRGQNINRNPKNKSNNEGKIKYFVPEKIEGTINRWGVYRLAWAHIKNNRIRTFLASVGVALGIGTIIGLVSLGMGLQRITSNQIASFNALVTVEVVKEETSANAFDDSTVEQLGQIEDVELVSPSIILAGRATIGDTSTAVIATGLNDEALGFEEVKLSSGEAGGIILTEAAAKNFGVSSYDELIGRDISLSLTDASDEENAESAVMSMISSGSSVINSTISGIASDDLVSAAYLSLGELKQAVGANEYTSIKIKANNRKNVEDIRNTVQEMGFATKSVTDLIKQIDRVFIITQIVLAIIGGVALIVSLLGIVNIMTISLIERTHEVGIMKAIGASDKEIGRIFSSEAGMLGLIGGTIGVSFAVLFALGVNWLIQALMEASGTSTEGLSLFYIPAILVIGMILLSYIVSLMAGWYPSRRASKLSALEALRYE